MRILLAPLLLTGCLGAPATPLAPTLACVADALASPVPAVHVERITVAEMRRRFGPWQGYFTRWRAPVPTIFLTHDAGRRVLVHEAARAVLDGVGRRLDPASDTAARRACGGIG